MCFIAISMPSLKKCAFRSLADFLLDCLFFDIALYKLFVHVGDKFPVGIFICKNFFHSEGCLISLMISFAVQLLLAYIRSHLLIFVLFFMILRGGSQLLHFMSKCVLFFSSKVSHYLSFYLDL